MGRRLAIVLLLALWGAALCAQETSIPSTSQASAPVPEKKIKSYHDGGIRDLDAVGNRNIGCTRGLGNWYSLESQMAMGRAYSHQVESTAKVIGDPLITEYVNRVGQNLVRNSDAQVPFTIKVLDSDEINAFALPGGFFYVDSGLILAADNEAELAGVMAHEIAHVAACHAARQNTRGQLLNLASVPLIFVGGGIGYAAQSLLGIAVPLGFLQFSRGFEADADYLGVQYMYKAGYDPQAFTSFFEKIQDQEKHKPGTIAKAFDTHPPTPDRIGKTQQEIDTLLPPRDEYKEDTSEFQQVKARLAELENRRKIQTGRSDRPALRRSSNAPAGGDGDDNSNDGPPVLKRHPDPTQP